MQPDVPSRSQARIRQLHLGFAVVVLALWAATAFWLWHLYDKIEAQARRDLGTVAHLLAEHTDRTVQGVDRLMAMLAPRLSDARGDSARLQELLAETIRGLPHVRAALVLNDDGRSIGDSETAQPRPFNGSDREYFRVHRERSDAGLFIGPPVKSRINGLWALSHSRRLATPTGEFTGVVVFAVDPHYFTESFAATAGLEIDSVSLVGNDRILRTRFPFDEQQIGQAFPVADDGRRRETHGPNRGTLVRTSPTDGIERLIAYQKTSTYPLTIVVGRSMERIRADAAAELVPAATIALLLTLLLAIGHRFAVARAFKTAAEFAAVEAARAAAVAEQWRFVSMASHEFRTPLAIIDGAAQRLAKIAGGDVDAAKRLERIRGAVTRMSTIIDRTLSSAKIAEGRIELETETVDLGELVHRCCARQRQAAPGFEFDIRVPGEEAPALIDPKLIEQVLANLLSNAAKFSGHSRRIEVSLTSFGDDWKIVVRDFGVGIPREDLPKLFARFFRARTAAGISGTGIGLNLVHELVRLHHGHVYVESEEGLGATFHIVLPRNQASVPQAA